MRFIQDLSPETIPLLQKIYKKSKYHRVRQRAQCLLLSYQGYTIKELSHIFQVDRITDIEQPLTRRNLIKPTNCFPKQAKDFNLHVVKTFNEVVDLALHRHADAVNPFQELEHPTQGWPLGWLVDLVW